MSRSDLIAHLQFIQEEARKSVDPVNDLAFVRDGLTYVINKL